MYLEYNVKTSDIALHFGFYVKKSDSIKKYIEHVLTKPNIGEKIFLNSLIVPKNLKRGTLWDFSIFYIEKTEWGTLCLETRNNFRKKVSQSH